MHEDRELLREAKAYFKSRPGFTRFLDGLAEKYQSLGRLGGVVTLGALSDEERSALEAFFRRRLPGGQVSIPAREFGTALAATKFGALNPKDVLQAWYGRELVGKKELRRRREQERENLLQALMAKYLHPYCQTWLKAALAKEGGTQRVTQAPEYDSHFVSAMELVLKALSRLPDKYQRLPVFAREVCGNPHGFDAETPAGKLLLDALRCNRASSNKFCDTVDSYREKLLSVAEETNELLYHFKLLRDDLLNFVTCTGLAAYNSGAELEYWQLAARAGAPLNIPLREIVRATEIYPWHRRHDAHEQQYNVYVVENSGVFSALLDSMGPSAAALPMVCMHGQFKLASWALLDRMIQSGAMVYYSGDFDPEGLQMAQKLLRRYPGRVRLWRMDEENYYAAGPSVLLDKTRLIKLKSVTQPELAGLAGLIAGTRTAAYQEGLVELLAEDVLNLDT